MVIRGDDDFSARRVNNGLELVHARLLEAGVLGTDVVKDAVNVEENDSQFGTNGCAWEGWMTMARAPNRRGPLNASANCAKLRLLCTRGDWSTGAARSEASFGDGGVPVLGVAGDVEAGPAVRADARVAAYATEGAEAGLAAAGFLLDVTHHARAQKGGDALGPFAIRAEVERQRLVDAGWAA